jgi:hypothetical protein
MTDIARSTPVHRIARWREHHPASRHAHYPLVASADTKVHGGSWRHD